MAKNDKYIDSTGSGPKKSGLKGASGKTYAITTNGTDYMTVSEITAMLSDGITKYVAPAPSSQVETVGTRLRKATAQANSRIESGAEEVISLVTSEYKDWEIASFDKQEEEARAILEVANTATANVALVCPVLSAKYGSSWFDLNEIAMRVVGADGNGGHALTYKTAVGTAMKIRLDGYFAMTTISANTEGVTDEMRIDACESVQVSNNYIVTYTAPAANT